MASQLLHPRPELHIVMIGKTRCGKSATGNTILRRKTFETRILSSSPVTQECQMETVVVDGQNLTVIDTPGLFGSTKSSSVGLSHVKKQEKVMEQIKECRTLASPSPVVFLVVLQLGTFTEDEQQTVKIIQRTFGRDAAHYTMALFIRGDDLKIEGSSIDELIGAHPALRDFVRECRGGYHVLENRDADPSQVIVLLQKINSIVQRNGERSSKKDPEGEGDLQNNSFKKAFLGGAFDGACAAGVILFVQRFIKNNSKPVAMVAAVVVGGVVGAARCVVGKLIWGSTQR